MSNKGSDENVANIEEYRKVIENAQMDTSNDSVYAHKFAVMQQQIIEKDKRIQELEEESESKMKAYEECYCNYKHYKQFESIPKQVVIDKIKELKKEGNYRTLENPSGRIHYMKEPCDYKIDILQELLGGEK